MFFQIVINIFEIIALVSGTMYVMKFKDEVLSRYFVYFLLFTVFVEIVFGWMPTAIYYLDSLKGLEHYFLLNNNNWIYNIYDTISFVFFLFLFTSLFNSKKVRKIGFLFTILFLMFSIFNLVTSSEFFNAIVSLNFIVGSLLLLLYVIYFFFQMLFGDQILDFYKTLPFYIGIGVVIYHLSSTPIFIYSKYFSETKSPDFTKVYEIIITTANIFVYTCYTLGFILCSRKNKSY
ncbi:hypothetical protein GCM10022393_27150 [Aquimarina addita]|uniref:Uncharacterized protein n=1 Tax=Aquimarina addita TaxID=870485 RepID=A0ABP6UPS2_9FLAO